MPKLSSETVTLLDGDIRVFKRPRSRAWQATFKMDGTWVRVSTKCKQLSEAKEAAHKKHYKIKRGQAIEGLDPESIKICLHENNFTELFDNLGILGEYQLECTNFISAASDVVAQKRAKKYGDKITVPDDDDTASDQDWNFKEMKSMSNRKGRNRLKKVEIKI